MGPLTIRFIWSLGVTTIVGPRQPAAKNVLYSFCAQNCNIVENIFCEFFSQGKVKNVRRSWENAGKKAKRVISCTIVGQLTPMKQATSKACPVCAYCNL